MWAACKYVEYELNAISRTQRMKNHAACGLRPAACAAPCATAFVAAYAADCAFRQVCRSAQIVTRPHGFSCNFTRNRVHTSMLHASEIAGDSLLAACDKLTKYEPAFSLSEIYVTKQCNRQ